MEPEFLEHGAHSIVSLVRGPGGSEVADGRMEIGRSGDLLGRLEEIPAVRPGTADPRRAFTTRFLILVA